MTELSNWVTNPKKRWQFHAWKKKDSSDLEFCKIWKLLKSIKGDT